MRLLGAHVDKLSFDFAGEAPGSAVKAVSATEATPYSNFGWLVADVARLASCF
jgi:hypothetical protein